MATSKAKAAPKAAAKAVKSAPKAVPAAPKTAATKATAKATSTAKQKIRITLRAFDHHVIDKAVQMIVDTAERSGAIVAGPIPLPTKIKKWTVNKSTFISKNAREQFEMRIHKRLIDLHETTATTIDALSSLTLPAGVEVEIKMM